MTHTDLPPALSPTSISPSASASSPSEVPWQNLRLPTYPSDAERIAIWHSIFLALQKQQDSLVAASMHTDQHTDQHTDTQKQISTLFAELLDKISTYFLRCEVEDEHLLLIDIFSQMLIFLQRHRETAPAHAQYAQQHTQQRTQQYAQHIAHIHRLAHQHALSHGDYYDTYIKLIDLLVDNPSSLPLLRYMSDNNHDDEVRTKALHTLSKTAEGRAYLRSYCEGDQIEEEYDDDILAAYYQGFIPEHVQKLLDNAKSKDEDCRNGAIGALLSAPNAADYLDVLLHALKDDDMTPWGLRQNLARKIPLLENIDAVGQKKCIDAFWHAHKNEEDSDVRTALLVGLAHLLHLDPTLGPQHDELYQAVLAGIADENAWEMREGCINAVRHDFQRLHFSYTEIQNNAHAKALWDRVVAQLSEEHDSDVRAAGIELLSLINPVQHQTLINKIIDDMGDDEERFTKLCKTNDVAILWSWVKLFDEHELLSVIAAEKLLALDAVSPLAVLDEVDLFYVSIYINKYEKLTEDAVKARLLRYLLQRFHQKNTHLSSLLTDRSDGSTGSTGLTGSLHRFSLGNLLTYTNRLVTHPDGNDATDQASTIAPRNLEDFQDEAYQEICQRIKNRRVRINPAVFYPHIAPDDTRFDPAWKIESWLFDGEYSISNTLTAEEAQPHILDETGTYYRISYYEETASRHPALLAGSPTAPRIDALRAAMDDVKLWYAHFYHAADTYDSTVHDFLLGSLGRGHTHIYDDTHFAHLIRIVLATADSNTETRCLLLHRLQHLVPWHTKFLDDTRLWQIITDLYKKNEDDRVSLQCLLALYRRAEVLHGLAVKDHQQNHQQKDHLSSFFQDIYQSLLADDNWQQRRLALRLVASLPSTSFSHDIWRDVWSKISDVMKNDHDNDVKGAAAYALSRTATGRQLLRKALASNKNNHAYGWSDVVRAAIRGLLHFHGEDAASLQKKDMDWLESLCKDHDSNIHFEAAQMLLRYTDAPRTQFFSQLSHTDVSASTTLLHILLAGISDEEIDLLLEKHLLTKEFLSVEQDDLQKTILGLWLHQQRRERTQADHPSQKSSKSSKARKSSEPSNFYARDVILPQTLAEMTTPLPALGRKKAITLPPSHRECLKLLLSSLDDARIDVDLQKRKNKDHFKYTIYTSYTSDISKRIGNLWLSDFIETMYYAESKNITDFSIVIVTTPFPPRLFPTKFAPKVEIHKPLWGQLFWGFAR